MSTCDVLSIKLTCGLGWQEGDRAKIHFSWSQRGRSEQSDGVAAPAAAPCASRHLPRVPEQDNSMSLHLSAIAMRVPQDRESSSDATTAVAVLKSLPLKGKH